MSKFNCGIRDEKSGMRNRKSKIPEPMLNSPVLHAVTRGDDKPGGK
jgi:hypothetical protein